jgi:hypothetical protein
MNVPGFKSTNLISSKTNQVKQTFVLPQPFNQSSSSDKLDDSMKGSGGINTPPLTQQEFG